MTAIDEATVVSIDLTAKRATVTLVRSPATKFVARIMEGLHFPPKRWEDAARDPQGQTREDGTGATWLHPGADAGLNAHYHGHHHAYGVPLAVGDRVVLAYLSGRSDAPVIIGRL